MGDVDAVPYQQANVVPYQQATENPYVRIPSAEEEKLIKIFEWTELHGIASLYKNIVDAGWDSLDTIRFMEYIDIINFIEQICKHNEVKIRMVDALLDIKDHGNAGENPLKPEQWSEFLSGLRVSYTRLQFRDEIARVEAVKGKKGIKSKRTRGGGNKKKKKETKTNKTHKGKYKSSIKSKKSRISRRSRRSRS